MELLQYNESHHIAPKDIPSCWMQTDINSSMMEEHTENNLPDYLAHLLFLNKVLHFGHAHRTSLYIYISQGGSQSLYSSSDKETIQ